MAILSGLYRRVVTELLNNIEDVRWTDVVVHEQVSRSFGVHGVTFLCQQLKAGSLDHLRNNTGLQIRACNRVLLQRTEHFQATSLVFKKEELAIPRLKLLCLVVCLRVTSLHCYHRCTGATASSDHVACLRRLRQHAPKQCPHCCYESFCPRCGRHIRTRCVCHTGLPTWPRNLDKGLCGASHAAF